MHKIVAPAKINLFLRVLERRADGYCELQTAYQFLDLCDELSLELRADGVVSMEADSPEVPSDEHNSVIQAARLLQAHCAVSSGVHFHLSKRIPMGGGLGGGSSDAASALLALNQLWSCNLGVVELATLGRYIGADVPVFVYGRAAYATGLGELLSPYPRPERDCLLVAPDAVSTADAFAMLDTEHCRPRAPLEELFAKAENDFSALVRAEYPEIEAAWSWLGGTSQAQMSGSGSGLFAYFENQSKIMAKLEQLPSKNWKVWAARSLNESPAHTALGDKLFGA